MTKKLSLNLMPKWRNQLRGYAVAKSRKKMKTDD
jgi:hypothetical protein